MAKRDYYEVLGVSRGAADEDIRSAYRRLARKYHPDLNPGDKQAEQKFKELGEAYEVLADPDKRKVYDAYGPEGVRAQAGGQGGAGPSGRRYTWTGEGSPFEDVAFEAFGGAGDQGSLFEELFSRLAGMQGRRGPRAGRAAFRGEDVETELALSFEQAIRGAKTTITVHRPAGDGSVRPERLEVRIPPGVHDGQRLRLRGRGGPGAGGGPAGDLYIVIHVQPHAYFRREGEDIYVDVPISVTEAALGGSVEVPTAHGRATLHIPPGASGGQRFRLRGQGVPRADATGRGDQYCVIRVVAPKTLNEQQRQLFEQLRRLESENPRADAEWNR